MKKSQNDDQMPLSGTEEANILNRLSERVERAVTTIQELRRERDQLRSRVEELEARLGDHEQTNSRLQTLEEESETMRRERGEIRTRIESILSNLESLESAGE
jgi:FtsZ-binding cell division protein ZapB